MTVRHLSLLRAVLDDAAQDLRFAVRVMRRAPGFTMTALATIALCLGANLAVFGVVNAVLLRPLPFAEPDRLVRIFNTYPKAGVPDDGASVANYYERRAGLAGVSAVSLYREGHAIVGEPGALERERVMRVTPDFFATLGAGPVLGRAFVEEETTVQTSRVAILSDATWRERYGADPGVVGRRVRVDGVERTIVGVLPRGFTFLSSKARLYLPLASEPADRTSLRRHWGSSSHMVARLAAGLTIEAAQADVDAHNAAVEIGTPSAKMMAEAGFRSLVVPLHAEHVAAVRPVLLLVQAGAFCLLLIGGVNLANLLLIRATSRLKELAVRQAIGGTRGRIVRQVIAETTLLTTIGAVLGLGLGAAGLRLLAALGADTLPLGAGIAFSARLAAAGMLAALALGLALAAVVAWVTLRGSTSAALAAESRGSTTGPGVHRLRHGLLVAQIALAFTLLSAAGVLGVSLRNVAGISPGFQSQGVLGAQISLPPRAFPDEEARRAFIDRLLGAIEARPGMTSAGIVTNIPFSGRDIKSAITVEGWTPRAGESVRGHYGYGVGGRYFEAIGVPLVEGRFLEPAEIQRGDRSVVVDADFARRYWPDGSALGKRLFPGPRPGSSGEAFTIVGVAGAMRQGGLTDGAATGAVFFPYGARFDADLFVVTRTAVRADTAALTLRHVLRGVDARLAVSDARSMDARIADSLVTRRSPAVLAALFGALALVLTAIGTYGVLSYAVAQRRREIALRIALGAPPSQVGRAFAALGLRLVAAGSVAGLAGAWAAGRGMQTLLFLVPPFHVPTLAAVAGIMLVVSLAACLIPSRRAARVSPLEALHL